MPKIDRLKLAAVLALRDERAYSLAAKLGISPTTLSSYARGHRTPPLELIDRIEVVLGIERGSLRVEERPACPAHGAA